MRIAKPLLVLLLVVGCYLKPGNGQCAACRDATAGSAPQARAGLRRAIPILGVPAFFIFSGILLFAFKHGPSAENPAPDIIEDDQ